MLRKKDNTGQLDDPLLQGVPSNVPRKTQKNIAQRAMRWIKANPKKSALFLGLFIVSAFIVTWLIWPSRQSGDNQRIKMIEPPKPQIFYSPLTGNRVSEADSKRPVIAAIVENSPEARPQSGLKKAGVVFESVSEGGITRFLALYQEEKPRAIGPVRSVRPHFASWVAAFDAGLAHVGGSDIPLRKLRSGQIKDLDQFFNDSAYYYSSNRYAPHSTYTSYSRLAKLAKAKGYTESKFTSWPREKIDEKKDANETGEQSANNEAEQKADEATSIKIPVSTGNFAVSYKWDSQSKKYTRYLAGAVHRDQEEGAIAPEVVIVIQVPHDIIRDSNGYSYPDVNTSGKGWIFQDGYVMAVTWEKQTDKSQIKFLDKDEKEITLKRGRTWISAIRPESSPSW